MPHPQRMRAAEAAVRRIRKASVPERADQTSLDETVSPSPVQIPSATYRLQLNRNFRFEDAIQILDYLRDLGITHVYVSPILGSRQASEHGYDATDPTRIDPDLGSEDDFLALQQELQKRGMGIVLDIVPNHMAASSENPWWMDVLENGPGSAFASYFDIDWHPGPRSLEGKILLPVLAHPYGEVLDSGEIELQFQDGSFQICYLESTFPLAPKTYQRVLNYQLEKLKKSLAEESPPYQEYSGILAALAALFNNGAGPAKSPSENRVEFEAIRGRLRQLARSSPEIEAFVQSNVDAFNGGRGEAASYNLLETLLSEQHYKLAYWQNVNESINYRRFFTITDLVGMRIEDPAVFEATHGLIVRLASKHPSTGLRIDHIDGLRDPEGYLQKLHDRLRESQSSDQPAGAYLVVEKILAAHELLPETWPVQGTTGYDYLNQANGIFVYRDNAQKIEQIYGRFIGKDLKFGDVLVEKKKLVMNSLLGVEVRALGRQLAELAGNDRYARELPRPELTSAMIETTAHLCVYRTYIRNLNVPVESQRLIEDAIDAARTAKTFIKPGCFDFLRDVLLLLGPPHVLPEQREARLQFVMRWQQFTGPIVAKGVEDTSLYVYYPLLSLNEVGGEAQPSAASSREEYFEFLAARQARWPHSLNASTTHDTKRSEDVRARINVLSELPDRWDTHLKRWAELNAVHKTEINGQLVPDGNEEYYIYQTLLGAYPPDGRADGRADGLLAERLKEHVLKATREAMVHTRWTRPNLAHEQALTRFIDAVLCPQGAEEFCSDFLSLQAAVAYFGMINGLSQSLLKITCPGVPDLYQGSELWDLRLVDPDNRQPVDFEYRMNLMTGLDVAEEGAVQLCAELLANWKDARIKQWLIRKALRFRSQNSSLFLRGDFVPVDVTGSRSSCLIAFQRRYQDRAVVVAVPRWLAQAGAPEGRIPPPEFWGDTRLSFPGPPPLGLTNVLTGDPIGESLTQGSGSIEVGELFRHFPVALASQESSVAGTL